MSKVEEIKQFIDTRCTECARGNLEYCIKHFTQEEREEYAAKYGCICGIRCSECCNYHLCGEYS